MKLPQKPLRVFARLYCTRKLRKLGFNQEEIECFLIKDIDYDMHWNRWRSLSDTKRFCDSAIRWHWIRS